MEAFMEKVQLTRPIDVSECAQRNALTNKPTELSLAAGTVGTVLDTLRDGEAFVVEFGSRGADECEWLGVLYASELQTLPELATTA
jgi:hypothetical protein